RAGHSVTVYERDEAAGGLVRFGVPDFKIEKWLVERRVQQLVAEGVEFEYGVDVGVDVDGSELRSRFDAVVVSTGARVPRDLPVKLRTSYALHEGGTRDFAISTAHFSGNGHVEQIHWMQNTGVPPFDAVPGTEETHPAGLVLLAMGFLGPEQGLLEQLGVERD